MDSESIERYDRQIRLWGQHGQNKCSNSKVCLVNANSIGTEVLKGLCLAGIGSFTILDSHKLTPDEVGSIFIPQNSVGKSRGEVVKSMLLELNSEVAGEVLPLESYIPHTTQLLGATDSHHSMDDDADEELNQDIEFWKQFNCVITCGFLNIGQIIRLSKICWKLNIPLILCKSIGFYGSMRCQIREHLVAETHPDWRPPNYDPSKPDNLTIQTRPIFEEYHTKNCSTGIGDDEDDSITISVGLKALDFFYSTYGRLPGCRDDQVETDIGKLKDCVKQTFGRSSSQLKTLDDCLYELCLYGGLELHATSAFMGGCIAQEVIKLVTNQYIPVDDTLVYNAVSASARSFKSNEIFIRPSQ